MSVLYCKYKVDVGLASLDFGTLSQVTITRLFGNRQSVFDMLRLESAELKALNYDKWWLLDMWRGDVRDVVAELRRTGSLNDLAVLVYETAVNSASRNPALLNAYIEQLRAAGHEQLDCVHKAVLLSLAVCDAERAVRIYMEHDLYQYALCLAHIRFPPQQHSVVLDDVLAKYAAYSNSVGDYETAVLCFLRLNDIESAYATLLRRNVKTDEQCAAIVQEISIKFENILKTMKSQT